MVPEQEVEEKTQREWLLQCPETYLGAVELSTSSIPVFESGAWRQVTLSPALVQLFSELFVNALDNGFRDDSQTYIHIEFKEGVLIVSNDGSVPPMTQLPGTTRYKIAGCFGGFQCGSNFDNSKKRYTGGRNGIGAAAANTFSNRMRVSVTNGSTNARYDQVWEQNMLIEHPPKITTLKRKHNAGVAKNAIQVEWYPDYDRFPNRGGDEDDLSSRRDCLKA